MPVPEVIICGPMGPCSCCECQGKKCLMYHPGHDHRTRGFDWVYKDARTEEEGEKDAK